MHSIDNNILCEFIDRFGRANIVMYTIRERFGDQTHNQTPPPTEPFHRSEPLPHFANHIHYIHGEGVSLPWWMAWALGLVKDTFSGNIIWFLNWGEERILPSFSEHVDIVHFTSPYSTKMTLLQPTKSNSLHKQI